MKEFNIDLVIDKTFNVFADSEEEAKGLAIQRALDLLGSYNGLVIDFIEEVESEAMDKADDDCEFDNEYNVYMYDDNDDLIWCYAIEADDEVGAKMAAKDFFKGDFPSKQWSKIIVELVEWDEDEDE